MKKILSVTLMLGILYSSIAFVSSSAFAAIEYNVNAAVEYAAKHVNDNDGSQCAEFVSKCVQAGGLNVPINTGTYSCWDAILNISGLSGINLSLNDKGYAIESDNINILARGDIVVQWCYTCNLRPHILICGGYDSEGYATFYAHNSALNNKRYKFSTNSQHKSSCNIGAKAVQLSKLNSTESLANSSAITANTTSALDKSTSLKQKCGDNAYWQLDNGVLTISGTGEMYNQKNNIIFSAFPDDNSINISQSIQTIIIENGITKIGEYAFVGMKNVKTISIPKTVSTIETGSFFYVTPDNVEYDGSKEDWDKITINGQTTASQLTSTFFDALTFKYISSDDSIHSPEKEIKILINNKFLQCDQPPVIVNNRTLVPMRAIFEALGVEVQWKDETQTAIGIKNNKVVSFTIGNKLININGAEKDIDVPAQIINSRTMIPARAVAEAFDCDVEWNGQKKYVIINPINQTPYKVEVLNGENEIVSVANFDNKGRIISAQGKLFYLEPFYLNLYGDCFVHELNSNQRHKKTIQFAYDDTLNAPEDDNIYVQRVLLNRDFSKYTYEINSHGDVSSYYTFDTQGLVTKYSYPITGLRYGYTYDDLGNLTKQGANGQAVINYEYDENKNLISAKLNESEAVTYRYIKQE